MANRDWMLDVISTITQGNYEYYQKDFVAKGNYQPKANTFVNNCDFF